jgi:hypothetical protein
MKTKLIIPTLIALSAAGCAFTPAQQSALDNLAAAVKPLVQSYAQTGHVSDAQAIPVALESLAAFEPSAAVDTAQLSTAVESAVNAFTNNTGASTGRKIAAAIVGALPSNPTGAQVNTALAQAGIGASNGANP